MRTLTFTFREEPRTIIVETEQSADPADGGACWYFEDGSDPDPFLTAKEEQEIAHLIEETREEQMPTHVISISCERLEGIP